mmetsp:Transcript_159/g.362  ORF Transcript_159/g.362 Transcript_159/m.362 type:complete len:224 (+) Transcript_159:617-1288(+)
MSFRRRDGLRHLASASLSTLCSAPAAATLRRPLCITTTFNPTTSRCRSLAYSVSRWSTRQKQANPRAESTSRSGSLASRTTIGPTSRLSIPPMAENSSPVPPPVHDAPARAITSGSLATAAPYSPPTRACSPTRSQWLPPASNREAQPASGCELTTRLSSAAHAQADTSRSRSTQQHNSSSQRPTHAAGGRTPQTIARSTPSVLLQPATGAAQRRRGRRPTPN